MYVSAAVSVHFCCCPLGTSVAMASQWDVHKQQSGWSQGGDWSQSGWSDASKWGTGGQPSGIRQGSDKLQAMADAPPPQFGVQNWTPSLRIA